MLDFWTIFGGIVVFGGLFALWLSERGGSPVYRPPRVIHDRRYFKFSWFKFSKKSAEAVIEASGYANQRISGRHLDGVRHYYVGKNMLSEFEVSNHLRWLLGWDWEIEDFDPDKAYGPHNDVFVHVMDGEREMELQELGEIWRHS